MTNKTCLQGDFISSLYAACRLATADQPGGQRWEQDIRAFEAADRASPPPRKAILFIGSSTIRKWESLAQDFSGHKVLNRDGQWRGRHGRGSRSRRLDGCSPVMPARSPFATPACRRLIESPWYQRRWGDKFKLSSDQNVKSHFENDRRPTVLYLSRCWHDRMGRLGCGVRRPRRCF